VSTTYRCRRLMNISPLFGCYAGESERKLSKKNNVRVDGTYILDSYPYLSRHALQIRPFRESCEKLGQSDARVNTWYWNPQLATNASGHHWQVLGREHSVILTDEDFCFHSLVMRLTLLFDDRMDLYRITTSRFPSPPLIERPDASYGVSNVPIVPSSCYIG
jgi:hypothetical protein